MEELWKDIHPSSLHENPTIFQDFLSLNSSRSLINQRYPDQKIDQYNRILNTPSFMSYLNSPFEDLAVASSSSSSSSTSSASSLLSCFTGKNKRVSDDQNKTDGFTGDRRHKRMMKNRESAARSRARRQAYTSELEREHAELMEENAKLRELQEKLLLSATSDVPKKRTHSRSLTAPF